MARKKKKAKVFNDRKRKVFRSYIGKSEFIFSVGFIGFTVLMGIWFATRANKYDPTERDISIEILLAQQVEDHLWETPLKRWVDPSKVVIGAAVGPDWGPIPTAFLAEGWAETSFYESLVWDTLYEKIDGAEVQYKSYGFQEGFFIGLSLEEEGLDFNIELYDMTTFENALGLFWAQRKPGLELIHEGNLHYYKTEVGAIGIVDRYYFKCSGLNSSPAILEATETFIAKFVPSVEALGDPPAMFTRLSQHFDFVDIGYIKEDAFQYEFCQNFWFASIDGHESARYYVHEAANEADAVSLFDQFYEEQSYEFEEVSREGNSVVFKHEFLDTVFILRQVGTTIYGVDGVEDMAKAETAVATLQELLFGTL